MRRHGDGGGSVGCGFADGVALLAEGATLLEADVLACGVGLEADASGGATVAVALGSLEV